MARAGENDKRLAEAVGGISLLADEPSEPAEGGVLAEYISCAPRQASGLPPLRFMNCSRGRTEPFFGDPAWMLLWGANAMAGVLAIACWVGWISPSSSYDEGPQGPISRIKMEFSRDVAPADLSFSRDVAPADLSMEELERWFYSQTEAMLDAPASPHERKKARSGNGVVRD